MSRADATFRVKSWDESPYDEMEGGLKLTRARVVKTYQGDISGESALEYLMTYLADGTAAFVGVERLVGSLSERSGSFVLHHLGSFENGVLRASYHVVPGSGTGELAALSGQGTFEAGHQEQYPFMLDYEVE